ncbi:MAG: hypothetical protein ABGZ53_28175 [Fuerstiella sp.]
MKFRRWEEWMSLLRFGQPIGEMQVTDGVSLQHELRPCILAPGGTTGKDREQKR